MAQYNIIDIGRPNLTNTGDKATGDDIANSGVRIPLKNIDINYQATSGIDNKPLPGQYDDYELNKSSTSNFKITVSGVIKRDGLIDIDNDSSADDDEIGLIGALNTARKTKGLKLFYYDGSSYNDVVSQLGTTSSVFDSDIGASTKYLVVRITNLTIKDNAGPKGLLRYTLEMENTT